MTDVTASPDTTHQAATPGQCHVDMVYAAALRQTGDAHLAADVTQSVFVAWARRAAAGKAPKESHMAGWLLMATRYGVKETWRARTRRDYHERQAGLKRGAEGEPADPQEVLTAVDEALLQLGGMDRELVLRRYLEGQAVGGVAQATGLRENTAGRRIARALEKLRKILRRRGVMAPAALGAILSEQVIGHAPAAILAAVHGAACGAGIASNPLADLIYRRMLMAKAKMAGLMTAAVALVIASSFLVAQAAGRDGAGPAGGKAGAGSAAATSRGPFAAATSPAPDPESPYTVQSGDGEFVQLVALAVGPSQDASARWWAPDGSAHGTPQASGLYGPGRPTGPSIYTFVVQFNAAPGSKGIAYRITTTSQGSTYSGVTRSRLIPMISTIKGNPATATFHLEFDPGPWTNFVTHPGDGMPKDVDAVAMAPFKHQSREVETRIFDHLNVGFDRQLTGTLNSKDLGGSMIPPAPDEIGRGFMFLSAGDYEEPATQYAVRRYRLAYDFKNVSLRGGQISKVTVEKTERSELPAREAVTLFLRKAGDGADLKELVDPANQAAALAGIQDIEQTMNLSPAKVTDFWLDGPRGCVILEGHSPVDDGTRWAVLRLTRPDKAWLISAARPLPDKPAAVREVETFRIEGADAK